MVKRDVVLAAARASQSPSERREASEGADLPRERTSEEWPPTPRAPMEYVEDDDTQWLMRWYPLFMAGVIVSMMALGGFWISQFVR